MFTLGAGLRLRFSRGAINVNRTFFQVLTPEFGKSARDRVEGFVLRERSHLVPEQGSRGPFSEHTFFSPVLTPGFGNSANAREKMVLRCFEYTVSERNTILYQCPSMHHFSGTRCEQNLSI